MSPSIPPLLLRGAADLVVLRVLEVSGECYGYQLIERIADASNDTFAFQEGTLYPLLYRLERDEYVTSRRKTGLNGKERRYYKITKKGGARLAVRGEEYRKFVDGLASVFNWAQV